MVTSTRAEAFGTISLLMARGSAHESLMSSAGKIPSSMTLMRLVQSASSQRKKLYSHTTICPGPQYQPLGLAERTIRATPCWYASASVVLMILG